MADINKVILVGRLTRDAEQTYTPGGYALLKFGIAVNRRRKQGEEWVDEANFFDVTVYGRQGEAIARYMTRGKQVAVDGQLRQDRWESQDGSKRSKVTIDASNVQLLGGREDREGMGRQSAPPGPGGQPGGGYQGGGWNQGPGQTPGGAAPTSAPPQGMPPSDSGFEDDIPF